MNFIYLLTNKTNSKRYVGVTNNLEKRMREHKSSKTNTLISRAIRKYGWEDFICEVIETTEDRTREQIYISLFECRNPEKGYNLTDGGEGTLGLIVTDLTRDKMRQQKVGKKLSPDHIEKLRITSTGKLFSKETRQKISDRLKGNKNFQGHSFSPETLEKLSKQKSKDWVLISPNGEVVNIHNMRNFCLENGLHHAAICRLYSGKAKQHKGWTAP